MEKNKIIFGIILFLILLANIEFVTAKPSCISKLSINIITEKERFPRFYEEGTIFNATIIITNNEPNYYEDLDIFVIMEQTFPSPRVPNYHEIKKYINLLEPDQSVEINFCWKPWIQGTRFGLFPLLVIIRKDNDVLKLREKYYIFYYLPFIEKLKEIF
jgi:hypothetical protein